MLAAFPSSPPASEQGFSIEMALLREAFGFEPLNLGSSLLVVLCGALLLVPIFPLTGLLLWSGMSSLSVLHGLYQLTYFKRSEVLGREALAQWQRNYFWHRIFSGVAWGLGSAFLLLSAQGAGLALLVCALLSVCSVSVTTMASQLLALQAFLVLTLAPSALCLLMQSNYDNRITGLALLGGMLTLVIVARHSHQWIMLRLNTQTRLQAVLDSSQDAIIEWDEQGRITGWNLRAEAIFGWPAGQALGQLAEELLVPSASRKAFIKVRSDFLSTGDLQGLEQPTEIMAKRSNHEVFPVSASLSPLKSGSKFFFTAFVTDITQRKRAEEQSVLFRRVFDSSLQCVGVADRQGNLIYQNRAMHLELGYSDAEILGQHISLALPEEHKEEYSDIILQAAIASRDWCGQMPNQRKDGSRFMSYANIGFIKDELGRSQYVFNIFTNFDGELARRDELAKAKEAAERANQAKSEFLSNMSHELRTPLNAIIGFAQMMEYDSTLNLDQLDNVHEILKAGRHLLTLINEVLDLAKIESGHVNLSVEPVALAEVLEECRPLILPLAQQRQIALQMDSAERVEIKADRVRMKQVLLNLLTNAIKYNRAGGQVRLKISEADEHYLRITVSDTGAGIPAERIAELFKPFNRLDAENSTIEGTGIGLSISHRLMLMMGGKVGVNSRPGEGSDFWIELPGHLEASVALSPAQLANNAPCQPDDQSCLLLCIDDNPVNLKLMAQILSQRPRIQTVLASGAEEGLALARQQRPDLILLDINMPVLNGFEVLSQLRQTPDLQATPVIAVTANAMPADQDRGLRAGFNAYLTKPLGFAELFSAIDQCLADRRSTAQ